MTIADGNALVESDRRYFEIGAHVESLWGAQVAHLVGLEHAAGAVVAHRVNIGVGEHDPAGLTTCIEAHLRQIGAHRVRIYLDDRSELLETEIRARGYIHRVEHGFVLPPIDARTPVVLRPVEGERDTGALFARDSPDGHGADAASLLGLHARKNEDPAFTWMTIRDPSGAVLGSVSAVRIGDLLRAKNLWIDPRHRRRGVAAAALAALERMASEEQRWLGIFSVAGSRGDEVYRALGGVPIVEWHEWALCLMP